MPLDPKKANFDRLVKKARSGDEVAFSKLYDLYFEKISRFIFYRVNHTQVTEDLVSETFVRAWNRISEIEDEKAFAGWLYQIARNLVIDHYRSRRQTVDLAELENVLQYEDNVIDKTDLSFKQQEFLKVIGQLTADQQLVIKLKFIDELENEEIAKILNKSEGAIRVIQHRAIALLKNLINNDDRES